MIGVNTASLKSKITSFDNMLSNLFPGVFFLQETNSNIQGILLVWSNKLSSAKDRVKVSFWLNGGLEDVYRF